MSMEKIAAMIGAGLIGRAWAMVFARAGWTVRLYDGNPAQLASARTYIGASLQEQQGAGLCDDAPGAQRRINYVESLQHAVGDAEWIHEHLPERLDVKRAIFRDLDRLAHGNAILASSTSAIPPSQFSENLPRRERFVVAYPVYPPPRVPVASL